METAKIFTNGRSQAVRLPKKYRFNDDEVFIKHIGNTVVLIPKDDPWNDLFLSLDMFSEDFMIEREQPPAEERKEIF